MRVQPLDDRVLVEPIDGLPTSPEGMLVLQSGVLMNRAVTPGEEECQRAVVVAVGPGEWAQLHAPPPMIMQYDTPTDKKSVEEAARAWASESHKAMVMPSRIKVDVQGPWIRKPMNIQEGDEVLIAKYASLDMNNNLNVRMPGREVTLDGKKLRMIDYNEVLGVFQKEPAKREKVLK